MPRPCEHVVCHQPEVGGKTRGSAQMRTKVINQRWVTRHDVAGSEAEESASSEWMTNVPYLKLDQESSA